MYIQSEFLDAIVDVVAELAMELDLHYDDDELPAIAPTFEKIDRLVGLLRAAGHTPPEVYDHIRDRYHRSLH